MSREGLKKICRAVEAIALAMWVVAGNYISPNLIHGVVIDRIYQTARLYSAISLVAVGMLVYCAELFITMESLTKNQFIFRSAIFALVILGLSVFVYFM